MKLVIGTRGSLLARTQSQWVRDQLGAGELKIITTRGDRLVDLPLQSNLEKGLFTKELEVALLDGDIDGDDEDVSAPFDYADFAALVRQLEPDPARLVCARGHVGRD